VCPTPKNTRPVNPPIKRSVGYPVRPVTKKVDLLPTERTIGGGCLIVKVGFLLLSALSFQVRHLSPTLQFCVELRFDHRTVTDWSQFCCKAMLNFILICSLQLILMVVGREGGGKIIIVAGCARQCAILFVSRGNQGHLSLIAPLKHSSPSLRHVSYPAPRLSVTAWGRTFVSAMMDSHTTTLSIAV